MPKRKRSASSSKVKQPYKKPRKGYSTVARTRGPLAKGEAKYFDTEKDQTALNASTNWTATEYDPAVFNCLFAPIQGSAINQRVGRSVWVTKLKIRGFVVCPAQTNQIVADAATVVRIILYQDTQTNGTFSQGEDIMAAPTTANAPLCVNTFQNLGNFGRFKVLKDKMMFFDNKAVSWDGTNMEQSGLVRPFKFNISFRKPVEVRFNATNGGSVSDIITNSFHLIANISASDLNPYITYQSRVVFKE